MTIRNLIQCLALFGFLTLTSEMVCAEETTEVYRNGYGLFSKVDPSSDLAGSSAHYLFYDNCSSSLEIPLWDNPLLEGLPKAYRANQFNLNEGWLYDRNSKQDFKYKIPDFTDDGFSPAELKKQWYTNGFLNGQPLFEDQKDALERQTESWPIRALVIARTTNSSDEKIKIEINTLTFDEKGNLTDGVDPNVKKRVGFACSSLFLVNKNVLESSASGEAIGFSYYGPEQRMCHLFTGVSLGAWWVTAGTLENHQKMLLTRCKSPFYIPLEPDSSNQAEVDVSEQYRSQKHLQSFIPSELDLNKPIESTNFILTVRFSDPVKPVYHASLPNVCLVDCPNTGAKQIEGLELKIKPIETKKNRQK